MAGRRRGRAGSLSWLQHLTAGRAVSCQAPRSGTAQCPGPHTIPRMNPTVIAAAIGVGGTVVVGVTGFLAAIRNTRKTITHARESRIWDRRANAYVEALAALHHRQEAREVRVQTGAVDDLIKQRAQAYFGGTYSPPDWHELEASLLAFASGPVVTAARASSTAHMRVMSALIGWQKRPARAPSPMRSRLWMTH